MATVLRIGRPAPTLAILPARVTGSVGIRGVAAARVSGLNLTLQARSAKTRAWVTVAHSRAAHGTFALSWRVRPGYSALRVVLPAQVTLAPSTAYVVRVGAVNSKHPLQLRL